MILNLIAVARLLAFIGGVIALFDLVHYLRTNETSHMPNSTFVRQMSILGVFSLALAVIIGFTLAQKMVVVTWVLLAIAIWTHVYKYTGNVEVTTLTLIMSVVTASLAAFL